MDLKQAIWMKRMREVILQPKIFGNGAAWYLDYKRRTLSRGDYTDWLETEDGLRCACWAVSYTPDKCDVELAVLSEHYGEAK